MYAALAAKAGRGEHESKPYNSCNSSDDTTTSTTSSSSGPMGNMNRSQSEVGRDNSLAEEQSKAADAQHATGAFNAADRWLNEPGREGIGLQACKLVVTSESDLMGRSPATFEARTPWWRGTPG